MPDAAAPIRKFAQIQHMPLADTAEELLLHLDRDGIIVAGAVLAAASASSPLLIDELVGRRFVSLLPVALRAGVQRVLDDAARERLPAVMPMIRLDHRDNRYTLHVSALAGDAGSAQLTCLLRGQASTHSPGIDRFDQALSLARVAWFERDLRTDIGIGSPSLAQIYGLDDPRGPWHFDEIRARIVDEDRELHRNTVAESLLDRRDDVTARTINYRIRRPDGALRHLEVRYRNLYSGDRPRAYGLIFDVTEAKEIEERLVESQNWLNLALSAAGVLLWDEDLTTNLVRTSPNISDFTGFDRSRSLWTRESLLATIDVGTRDVFIDALRHWSTGNVNPRPRFQVRGDAGELRWIEASGNVEFDDDGKPRRLFGVSWDVTAQVAEEFARKASDEQLAQIADLVPGVVYTFRRDAAGRYSMPYASSGIADVFGVAPSAVRHDAGPILAMIHPDDIAGLATSIEASADRMIRWQYECRFVRGDGSQRWLFGTATPQRETDGAVRWHGHIVDVTERHEAQQQLRESQARLTLALSSARMSSWHWDLQTDSMKTTRALADMVGLDAMELPSAKVFDLIHADDVAALRDCFDKAMHADDDETFSIEYRFLWPDGDYRWVELRARAMRDEHGKVIAFDGVSSDITERRRAEVERERLQRQLSQAQKMEAIGLLTGGIAHDFNNILASVLGYSSLALQRFGTKNPPKLADYLAEVIKAGERARDLVAQMLAFSRGETTEVVQVDIAPLVDQIMKMLRPTLPSSIEIEVDLAAGLPPIAANVVQIQQVLLNLCINARDAMVSTGRIVIAARQQQFAPTECASCHKSFQGDYVVLSVTDDGMGIPEPQRLRIFEPFFTTKANQKGTGMGLSTVHGIVHRHRGHIGLVSQVTVGSTFSIALPLTGSTASTSPAAAHAPLAKPPSAVRAAHILVVDDEPSIAQCTAEMLELAGFTVEVETDSVKAEARLREMPYDFDVLITDQTMPRMTGHQLALSALNERPDLPVLLVTGHSAMVNERQAHALGIRAFLRKPVPRDELLNAVNDALSEADARRA